MRQAYDYWQDQPGCSPTRRALRAATRDALPFGKGVATRTLNARASDQANAHEPQKDSRARSFSDEANPSCCPFPREEKKRATRSGMNGRTQRARRNQSIDTLHAPALGCSHCNYSWQTATPEGSCDAASKSARAQRFHEGTPCCEPPNNSSPAHPSKKRTGARAGRSHSRELQTGGSHRETAQSIHTLPRHKAPREEEPKTGVLLGATDRGVKPFPRTERRRDSTRDDAGPTAQRRTAARGRGLDHHNRDHTQAHGGTLNICHRRRMYKSH